MDDVKKVIEITKGELEGQHRQVQEIFAYLQTEEGRELLRSAGLIVPDRS